MSYHIFVTTTARALILEQARYIAVDCQSPLNAGRWLKRIYAAADTLAAFPTRCPLAPENQFRDYEIRRLLVGDYFMLFTIVETDKKVWIIGFRHGNRLPRPEGLPDSMPNE